MSKAFTKEDASGEAHAPEEAAPAPAVPAGSKNYISPAGFARLKAELRELVEVERPEVVKTVAWAASNGDRSENGDYIYGKKRLREIDRRVRFLIKRLENAEVVHSSARDTDQVFFGAAVRIRSGSGERTVTILGLDEADPARGVVSWISPIAKALIKARVGDTVTVRTPAGEEKLEILEVTYPSEGP
jgi:transcription elongation factor GreB